MQNTITIDKDILLLGMEKVFDDFYINWDDKIVTYKGKSYVLQEFIQKLIAQGRDQYRKSNIVHKE